MSKKLIRFDWAIKKLLRDNRNADQQNFAVLEGFLSELLFDDIKIERIYCRYSCQFHCEFDTTTVVKT